MINNNLKSSPLKSNRRLNFITPIMLLASLVMLTACSPKPAKNRYEKSPAVDAPLMDPKYSLSADRKKLEELRKEVPADIQQENDEWAFMLQLLAQEKKPTFEVRSQFDNVVRKKRQEFDKDITKEREEFTRDERKNREEFLKKNAADRKDFLSGKSSSDDKKEFYREQEVKRSDYFANERDKRADFESNVRERRKTFEDYIHEKRDEFNSEMKAYNERVAQRKKDDKLIKDAKFKIIQQGGVQNIQVDDKEPNYPSTPLKAGDENNGQ